MKNTIAGPITIPGVQQVSALIIDDEKIACNNLLRMLQNMPRNDIHISGIAHDTHQAEARIKELQPDVVFLDIDMPNEDAFSFLARIAPFPFEVVFVTAYDAHAIRAFKLNAVDYIVKPVDPDELTAAVEKARERIFLRKILKQETTPYADLVRQISRKEDSGHITLRDSSTVEIVPFKHLLFVEAMCSYSKIVFLKNNLPKTITMSRPIAEYNDMLPEDMFYRVHRSYLINCKQIGRIIRQEHPYVELLHGTKIPIGRRRYNDFLDFLKVHHFYDAL